MVWMRPGTVFCRLFCSASPMRSFFRYFEVGGNSATICPPGTIGWGTNGCVGAWPVTAPFTASTTALTISMVLCMGRNYRDRLGWGQDPSSAAFPVLPHSRPCGGWPFGLTDDTTTRRHEDTTRRLRRQHKEAQRARSTRRQPAKYR